MNHSRRLAIRVLGPLEVTVAGRPVRVDTRKALAIVALLAAESRPFARDELAAMFWPESDDQAARGALRRTLSSLRAAVGDTGVIIERTQVALDPAVASVDLAELERMAGSMRIADLESAANLARGPFLAGFTIRDSPGFDEWQAARAVRVERQVGDVLDRLAVARVGAGDLGGAVEAARRRVALDALDELGQRRLIEFLARSGDRVGAIRQYRDLVGLFDRELGVAPLRETAELYEAIRDGAMEEWSATGAIPATAARSGPGAGTSPTAEGRPLVVPTVGRDAELAAVAAAWGASATDGRVVLLEGEAGIGKTRLADEASTAVRAAGGVVLAARGYPGESAIAYGPVAELLRAGLATDEGTRRFGGLDETVRIEVGRLVDLPASVRPSTGSVVTVSDPGSARLRFLEAVATSLTALVAGSVPGMIWIDDVHLVDDPSREALAYLARRLAGRPLLLLLAWRQEDLTPAGAATADALARRPDATSIGLRRLDRDEIAAIVRAARSGRVDDALIDGYAADSEGLPLHLVAALESGEPPGSAVPRGVQALFGERIATVGETAAQVLSAAAVIGRSFDLTIVGQSSGRSEEETVQAIEELTRRGIIREVHQPADPRLRYDFTHGRMRDAAYEATSLARRRLLHRRTADAIRSEPASVGRDELTRSALIAGHEREAGRALEAMEAFVDAADHAEAVFANRQAIDHLEASLALGNPEAAVAHARIGELRARLGDYPAAIAALETAAALTDPSGLSAIEVALGRVQRRRGDLPAAASHLDGVLALPDLPESLRARALVERSIVALRAGDLETAGEAATAAREASDRVGDAHLAGLAERLTGLVAEDRGDLTTARAALERSLSLAEDDPDPTASIAARTALGLALAAGGSVDDGVLTMDSALELCRRIGDRHLEAAVENHLADVLHDAGRVDESMTHLKRAVGLFAEIGEGAPEPDPGIWTLAAW
jgi:DNA-binding SARP family transcriptional activator/tetratricopeptide (TPR) repeat protein